MSLQVWLPLNGNLENQGLNQNVTLTNNDAVATTGGKLGQSCYQFGTAASDLLISSNAMTDLTNTASVCFWLKILNWNTSWATFFQAGINSTAWTAYTMGFLRNNANSNCCFAISNGSSCTQTSCITSNLELNTWYHISLVYTTGHILLYVNGNLQKDFATSIVPNFSNITKITIGRCANQSSYQTNCLVNDFRIYDNALTTEEIKLISQGLILHYPLSQTDIEPTTNLCTTGTLSSNCYNGAINKYNYGTTTDMYKVIGQFQNSKCTKVYMGTAGNSAYPYVFFDNLHPAQDNYKTLSFDYYPTSQTQVVFYSYNGSATMTYSINNAPKVTGTTISVKLNQWNHIEVTLLGTSSQTSGWGYMRIGSAAHTSTTTEYWLFANIQIEAKDHATPYVGPNGTRNTPLVQDISGYNNNATTLGTFQTLTDTKRYNLTTKFNGSNTRIITTNELSPDVSTLSVWIKSPLTVNCHIIDGRNSSGNGKQPIYSYTNGSIQTGGNNSYVTTNTGLLVANTWVHVALVQNGNSLLVYKNGSLFQTISCTNTPLFKSSLGARYTNANYFNGQLSDFRFYATALSADDILQLYKMGV